MAGYFLSGGPFFGSKYACVLAATRVFQAPDAAKFGGAFGQPARVILVSISALALWDTAVNVLAALK